MSRIPARGDFWFRGILVSSHLVSSGLNYTRFEKLLQILVIVTVSFIQEIL